MKIQHVFRTLAFLILVSVSLVATQPALAASIGTHYHYVYPLDVSFTWPGPDNPCGFDLQYHIFGPQPINYWVDSENRLTRYFEFGGRVMSEISANGKTVFSVGGGAWHLEYISENEVIYKYPGNTNMFIVPGHGKILGGVGMTIEMHIYDPSTGEWTIDVLKDVGKSAFDPSMFGELCAYFAS